MTEKAPERIAPSCVEALENYQQADMDGIMVLASRQAIHETIDAYWARVSTCEALQAERDALAAEVERIEGERDAALDTLKAWFDRRKLAHEAIDETVLDAVRGYLRTSRSGGMDQKTSDMIENVIADMARLSVFADLFARAALEEGKDG